VQCTYIKTIRGVRQQLIIIIFVGASRRFAFYVAVPLLARARTQTLAHSFNANTVFRHAMCILYMHNKKYKKNWPATVRRRPRAVKWFMCDNRYCQSENYCAWIQMSTSSLCVCVCVCVCACSYAYAHVLYFNMYAWVCTTLVCLIAGFLIRKTNA